jgi:photosystem II stability/assembly factor-like uncharacterized protein
MVWRRWLDGRITARRVIRVRPAWLAAVCIAAALGGCGAVSGATAASRTPPASRPGARAQAAHVPSLDVTLAYRRSGLGVVGLAKPLALLSGSQSSDPRLELTEDFRHWRNVTPEAVVSSCRAGCLTVFEDAFFMNARVGWVTTYNALTAQDDLYRTTDGGASWQLQLRAHHSENAGAQGWVQFLDQRRGWVAMLEPTAPGATYWQSNDGGAVWKRIRPATDRPAPPWPFSFISARVGYAAPDSLIEAAAIGGDLLFRTDDAGRSWTRQSVRLPAWYRRLRPEAGAGPAYELPTFNGRRHGVLPVLLAQRARRATLAFYTTADGGRRWRLASTLGVSTATVGLPAEPQVEVSTGPLVSIAGPRTWWVATTGSARGRGYLIHITTDGGRRWAKVQSDLPLLARSLQATGPRLAWAIRTVFDRQGNGVQELEQTTDGGLRWTRVRP